MAASSGMYDNALLGILQHVGDPKGFLDVLFSFLYRRTDFFRILGEGQNIGFPPGIAEKLVLQTFRLYQRMGLEDEKKRKQRKQTLPPPSLTVPSPENTVEVETTVDKETTTTTTTTLAPAAQGGTSVSRMETDSSIEGGCKDSGDRGEPGKIPSSASDKVEGSRGRVNQQQPDTYNGAQRDNYSWSQTATDVDLRVTLPSKVVKAKDVIVKINPGSLTVGYKGTGVDSSPTILLEGKLVQKVKCEDSMWTLTPGESIQINLEKSKEVWWKSVMEGEPEIDQQAIVAEKHLHEYDEESQADWRRAMFDLQQKQMGKPTSQELKAHDILKQAWDAPGSPFKGQPFDPSKVNLNVGDQSFDTSNLNVGDKKS